MFIYSCKWILMKLNKIFPTVHHFHCFKILQRSETQQ